ncbi:MAG TPA: AraC family ligand binding domain-containing protein [Pyrinomonadaceae bacterium]|nr:AraC family ligand binding domain-containing protein [Pyrinomonadaceae bacterium]
MQSSIHARKHLRDAELGGVILTEFVQPPLMKVPTHRHECATVLFTINGFAADYIAGRTQECRQSSLLIRPPEESHTHYYGRAGVHGLVVEIKPERYAEISSCSAILDRVGNFQELLLAELGLRLRELWSWIPETDLSLVNCDN